MEVLNYSTNFHWKKNKKDDICQFICIIFLNITLIANSFSHGDIKPSDILVQTVGMLAFGCLGLTSIDKYTKNKKQD